MLCKHNHTTTTTPNTSWHLANRTFSYGNIYSSFLYLLFKFSSIGDSTSDILKIAIEARSRALGPFSPTFDVNKIVHDALTKALPEDCHKKCNGRLHISVTRVSDGKNVILSQFDSKEDLIQVRLIEG